MAGKEFNLRNLQQTLLRNSAVIFGARLLSAAGALLLVPLVVARVGLEGYGTWEAILATAMLPATFQNAVSGTVLWKVAGEFANDDHAGAAKTIRISMMVVVVEATVALVPAWLLRHWFVELLNVPDHLAGEAQLVLPATVAAVMLSGVGECLAAAVTGCQKSGTSALAQALGQIANYAAVVGCLAAGTGLMGLVVGQFVGAVVTGGLLLAMARRLIPGVSLMPTLPSGDEARRLWVYGKSMMVGSVAIALRGQATKVITASIASPVWTGYYGLASRLAATILLALSFFSLPAVSAFGALQATGRHGEVHRLYLNMLKIVCAAAGAVTVVVLSVYDRAMVVWLGVYMPEVTPLLVILVATNTAVTILTGIGSSLCKGVGRPELEVRYVVAGLGMNLVLLPLGVSIWGAFGAVAANAIAYVLSALYFFSILQRSFALPVAVRRLSWVTVGAITVAVAGSRLVGCLSPLGTSRLGEVMPAVAQGTLGVIVFAGLMVLMGELRWPAWLGGRSNAQ